MKQYTIRSIPERLDSKLRSIAAVKKISLNTLAIELLMSASGLKEELAVHHDLDELAGTWVQDPDFDAAMADFEKIDEALWS